MKLFCKKEELTARERVEIGPESWKEGMWREERRKY